MNALSPNPPPVTKTYGEKEEKKGGNGGKGGKRAEAGGGAQNITDEDQNSTEEEEDQPMAVARKIYRGTKARELRKLNNGGKLEMVPIAIRTHNSSDFSDMVLIIRPKGRKRSNN